MTSPKLTDKMICMRNNLWRIVLGILIGFLAFYVLQYEHDYPPEIAKVTDLRVGYYSHAEDEWVFLNQFPIDERRLKVCGTIAKSRPVELLFKISNPNDINDFLYLGEWYFEIEPGQFCETLYVAGEIVPGKYTLWILDARRTAGQLDVEYVEE